MIIVAAERGVVRQHMVATVGVEGGGERITHWTEGDLTNL